MSAQPEPATFEPPYPFDEVVDLRNQYSDRGLQIIIKMEAIELNPEKPNFPGGDWRIEGQLVREII